MFKTSAPLTPVLPPLYQGGLALTSHTHGNVVHTNIIIRNHISEPEANNFIKILRNCYKTECVWLYKVERRFSARQRQSMDYTVSAKHIQGLGYKMLKPNDATASVLTSYFHQLFCSYWAFVLSQLYVSYGFLRKKRNLYIYSSLHQEILRIFLLKTYFYLSLISLIMCTDNCV